MGFKAYTVPLLAYQNPLDPFFGTNFNLNKLDADSNRCARQKKAKKHKKGFPKRRSWMKDRSMTSDWTPLPGVWDVEKCPDLLVEDATRDPLSILFASSCSSERTMEVEIPKSSLRKSWLLQVG